MIVLPELSFSVYQQIVLSVLLISWIYQLYFYSRFLSVAIRRKRSEKKGKLKYAEAFPPVSVIICGRDATDLLSRFLPEVLTQDYPDYEVIVVNDGANEETDTLLRELKKTNPHLKSTFVPSGTTNISTKKLALSLGIKAASHDWLVFTDADCLPESRYWLRTLARNFVPGVEIVLGYGAYLTQKGMLNRMITYDTLFIALQYLGFARAGKPYMGVGRNLAYHKSVFFRNNGFSSNLHLPSGDDDLFVNRAANKSNTRIESSMNSITWSEPNTSLRAWLYQKQRHLSVSSHYSQKSKLWMLGEPLSRALFYISCLVAMASFAIAQQWWMLSIPGAFFLLRFIVQMAVINKSSRLYSDRIYGFDMLVFDLFLPLVTLYLMTIGRIGKKARYSAWK
ncbi:MAG: glycosyltransferase [Paludibacter sp.]|jgi:glycosyltransferase involved in cell wall biosynthesis|nr:glycosyltransferase [Paludibacter sp.]